MEIGRRWRAAALLVAVLAAAVGAAGCGSSKADAPELRVVGTEMAFDAPEVVDAGTYTLHFVNAGAVSHEVAVRDASGEVLVRLTAEPGGERSIETALSPGRYELGCFEPGHYEAGMRQQLTVE